MHAKAPLYYIPHSPPPARGGGGGVHSPCMLVFLSSDQAAPSCLIGPGDAHWYQSGNMASQGGRFWVSIVRFKGFSLVASRRLVVCCSVLPGFCVDDVSCMWSHASSQCDDQEVAGEWVPVEELESKSELYLDDILELSY